MNIVSEPVSVYPLEWNISIPTYFSVPFQGVSELPLFYNKKNILSIKKNPYTLGVLKKV